MALGSAAAALSACAGDEVDGFVPAPDAADEASLLGDAGVDVAVEAAAYDVCGDNGGLEREAPWPVRGGCPKRASVAVRPGPRTASVRWSTPLAAGASAPVVSASRVVWVGTDDGDVVAVSLAGTPVAALHTGDAVRASVALAANGVGYVGSQDGTFYGFVHGVPATDAGDADADAGELDASLGGVTAVATNLLGPTTSSAVIGPDGTIFVGFADGTLKALSADGKSVRWSARTGDVAGSSPAIADPSLVVVGSSDGHVLGIAAADGTVRWSFATAGPVEGSPAVGDGVVAVGTTEGTVHLLNLDGTPRWSLAVGGAVRGTPAIAGNVVAVGSDDRKLHAIDLAQGKELFAHVTQGTVASPLIDVQGYVYAGSTDGRVYVITPGGSLFFAVNVRGAVTSPPALGADGTLYVTTSNALVAIGP